MTITGVIENVSPGKTSGATYVKLDTGDIAGTMDHDKRRASDRRFMRRANASCSSPSRTRS